MVDVGHFVSSQPRAKRTGADSVAHFHGNCLKGKGNFSGVRNTVLTHLIMSLRGCFRDASQNVVEAAVTGSFKSPWPAKINQGNLYALTLSLRFIDSLYECFLCK